MLSQYWKRLKYNRKTAYQGKCSEPIKKCRFYLLLVLYLTCYPLSEAYLTQLPAGRQGLAGILSFGNHILLPLVLLSGAIFRIAPLPIHQNLQFQSTDGGFSPDPPPECGLR